MPVIEHSPASYEVTSDHKHRCPECTSLEYIHPQGTDWEDGWCPHCRKWLVPVARFVGVTIDQLEGVEASLDEMVDHEGDWAFSIAVLGELKDLGARAGRMERAIKARLVRKCRRCKALESACECLPDGEGNE